MSHAELCPVCGGKGLLHKVDGTATVTTQCHGCGGRGWVEVGTCEPIMPPIQPCPIVPPNPLFPCWPYYPMITWC